MRHLLPCLLLAIVLMASCASKKTATTLNDIETYIQERPDSALAVIRAIDTTTLSSRSLRAHYSLLHAMALDKNWIDTTDAGIVMPAVEYYDRHPSGIRRAKAWYYLGRIQENGGDFSTANISFLKAEKYARDAADSYFKALIYQALSSTYSATYLHEEALHYSELTFLETQKDNDTLRMNAARYRIAQDLNNLNRFQEADSIFRLLVSEKKISSHLWPSLLSDYALFSVNQNNPELAVQLFDEAISDSGGLRTRNHWGAYAYALIRVGETDRANAIFKQLEASDNDKTLRLKQWKARSEAFFGHYPAAYEDLNIASEIQRNNLSQVLRQSTLRAQKDYLETEKAEMQRQEKRLRSLLTLSLIMVLGLAVGGSLFYIFRRRQMQKERESLLESIQRLTALSADRQQVDDDRERIRRHYITLCQAHFRQLGRINEILALFSRDKGTSLYKEIKKAVKTIQDDKESQKVFERDLDRVLDNVMCHYRESFPNKRERHYLLASFLFAGFDAAIISNILYDCSKDNVYLTRTRIRKAVKESDSPYKEQFLELLG